MQYISEIQIVCTSIKILAVRDLSCNQQATAAAVLVYACTVCRGNLKQNCKTFNKTYVVSNSIFH